MLQKARFLRSPVLITILLIGIVLSVSDYHFRLKNNKWSYAINSDGYDYYRYLQIVFIDHNYSATDPVTGKPLPIKHYVGTAIFNLPFFAIAYLGSVLLHYPLDGVSILFEIAVTFGTLLYLLWGLYFLAGLMKLFSLSQRTICIVLPVTVFATNIFYYTVLAPGWSHIISFSLVAFLLYHFRKISLEFNKRSLAWIIIATSFLFWTRPTDAVIILAAPVMAGSGANFIRVLKESVKHFSTIVFAVLVALVPLFCQLLMYKLQTGHFLVWSYTNEGFDFTKPEIMNVLFSYAKGLFVYAPVLLVALCGLFWWWRRSRWEATGILLYIFINIYIISSWWCWNYGVSYGPRAFIGQMPVFFLALGFAVENLSRRKISGFLLAAVLGFCVLLNSVQMYQCEAGILDVDFKTDKRGYWDVFMNVKHGYSGKYYRLPVDSSAANVVSRTVFFNNMEAQDTNWLPTTSFSDKLYHSPTHSSLTNTANNFSAGLRKYLSLLPYRRNVVIRASAWFYISSPGTKSYFTFACKNKGKTIWFRPYALDGYMSSFGKWEHQVFEEYMPRLPVAPADEKDNTIEFYMFNGSDIDCYMDDLTIEFVEYKKLDRVLDIWWDQ